MIIQYFIIVISQYNPELKNYTYFASSRINTSKSSYSMHFFLFNFQAEILDTAIKGTLNVLSSCAKFPSIKRVVFTSSMGAVLLTGTPLTPETVVDETWFSVPQVCEKHHMVCILITINLNFIILLFFIIGNNLFLIVNKGN